MRHRRAVLTSARHQIYARLRAGFASGVTKPVRKRQDQLLRLAYMLKENQAAFEDALFRDLHRPKLEANLYVRWLFPPSPSPSLYVRDI
jgi:hypothetical protein